MAFPKGSGQFLNGVPIEPQVVGGSGREYFGPQQALDAEASTVTLDTTAAGTTDGTIITTIAVVADQFNGQEVVITDPAAANGGIAEHAEIVDTIAPDTLVLNRPFNPGVGVTYAIIDKKKIAVNASFEDDILSVVADAEINLGGNVIRQINVTGAVRCLRVRNGRVRDGISWTPTTIGCLILDGVEVSQREGTEDAVIMDPVGVNANALEMYNSKAYGRVRGMTENARWILNNVTDPGVINAAGFNNAFSVVNADGVALAPTNVLLSADRVDGSVALYHAEGGGDINGGDFTDMRCFIGGDPTVVADTSAPSRQVSFAQADDTSTMDIDITDVASLVNINMEIFGDFSHLRCRASSGTVSVADIVGVNTEIFQSAGECNVIKTEGACSGAKTDTLDGFFDFNLTDGVDWSGINFFGGFTGDATVDGAGTVNVKASGGVFPFNFGASQAAGAPTGTFAPTCYFFECDWLDIFHFNAGVAISVGTWEDSAQHWANDLHVYYCTIPGINREGTAVVGVVTGGTWDRSGDDDCGFASPGDSVIRRARNSATAAATLTCSGNASFSGGSHVGTQTCTAITATATTITSGLTFYFSQAYAGFGGFNMIAFAAVAGAVATSSGTPIYDKCNFYDDGMRGAESSGTVTVPGSFAIRDCFFVGTFTLRVGAGAFAGACSVFTALTEFGDIVTINGTNFPSWESEVCVFFGQPASLGFVTVDPTFFVFFNCVFYGTSHLINGSLTLGKPVKINSALSELSGAATTDERLGKYDTTATLIDLTAVTDNVLCVFQLGGTAGAGGNQRGIVDGWGFVVSDGNVTTQGDALEPEAAGSRVASATVKRVGYALDAPAFPVAANDRLYARIHVDR